LYYQTSLFELISYLLVSVMLYSSDWCGAWLASFVFCIFNIHDY